MNFDLTGKRAFITGSSRGIGSAIAVELARGGADVVIHCSAISQKVEAVKNDILAFGRKCTVVVGDLRDTESVKALANQVGNVDILVLNASIQYKKKWESITIEDFTQQMTCNCLASLLFIQAFVPMMKENKWGRVITIGSVQEAKPHPDMLVYSASKCAQTGLALSLASQLASCGITVNNIAPGVIYTDRNKEALGDSAYAQKVRESIPVGFYGEKEDCAGIVRLLCSEAGRYITGQSIYVDGGKSL